MREWLSLSTTSGVPDNVTALKHGRFRQESQVLSERWILASRAPFPDFHALFPVQEELRNPFLNYFVFKSSESEPSQLKSMFFFMWMTLCFALLSAPLFTHQHWTNVIKQCCVLPVFSSLTQTMNHCRCACLLHCSAAEQLQERYDQHHWGKSEKTGWRL